MELPQAFINRIKHQFNDAGEFLEALKQPAVTSIRNHPVKKYISDLSLAEKIEWCESAFYLKERPVFTLDPSFHAGAYYVQESSSMFLWTVLEQLFDDKNIRILDLCAAPGGKSTLIASWLNGEGLLVSNEVIKPRAKILLENITKWGYSNTWVTNTDAYVLGGLPEFFDAVVIDAPCSGEGLFRKDAGAIEEWSQSNCDLCSSRQRKILAEIIPSVKEGGYVIYSTCTYNPEENDENVKWLLEKFPFEVVTLNVISYKEATLTNNGGVAFYPHKTQGEGFYCCILRKTGEVESNDIRKQKQVFSSYNSKQINLDDFVTQPFLWLQKGDEIIGINEDLKDEFKIISEVTKITGGYLHPGEIKGNSLIPSHALAMSIYATGFEKIALDKDQSLHFLAKRDFKLPQSSNGWLLADYNDLPLGFLKNLGNRFNNYYPMDWRIRMDF